MADDLVNLAIAYAAKKTELTGMEKYGGIIKRAKLLDPSHQTTAEARRTGLGTTYPYIVCLVYGNSPHNGQLLVSGLDLESAEEIADLWNGMKP
ncbi:hypothetical protein D3C81_908780 [compost metagenome]